MALEPERSEGTSPLERDRLDDINHHFSDLERMYQNQIDDPVRALIRIGALTRLGATQIEHVQEVFTILGLEDPKLRDATKNQLLQAQNQADQQTAQFYLNAARALGLGQDPEMGSLMAEIDHWLNPAVQNPAAQPVQSVSYDPLTITDEELRSLPASERAQIYHARLKASGWSPPPPDTSRSTQELTDSMAGSPMFSDQTEDRAANDKSDPEDGDPKEFKVQLTPEQEAIIQELFNQIRELRQEKRSTNDQGSRNVIDRKIRGLEQRVGNVGFFSNDYLPEMADWVADQASRAYNDSLPYGDLIAYTDLNKRHPYHEPLKRLYSKAPERLKKSLGVLISTATRSTPNTDRLRLEFEDQLSQAVGFEENFLDSLDRQEDHFKQAEAVYEAALEIPDSPPQSLTQKLANRENAKIIYAKLEKDIYGRINNYIAEQARNNGLRIELDDNNYLSPQLI